MTVRRSILTVMSNGTCRCFLGPRGEHGLTSFAAGYTYRFQRIDRQSPDGRRRSQYIRVYPVRANEAGDANYYEPCRVLAFLKFFTITQEIPVADPIV